MIAGASGFRKRKGKYCMGSRSVAYNGAVHGFNGLLAYIKSYAAGFFGAVFGYIGPEDFRFGKYSLSVVGYRNLHGIFFLCR